MSPSPKRQWTGLRLDPLDVLFFRDGRPFDAANRVSGGLPNPQTLAGALRTAMLARHGFDFRAFARQRQANANVKEALKAGGAPEWIIRARFRGPWLACESAPNEPFVATPAILTAARDREGNVLGWYRSGPLPAGDLPGWSDPGELLPLWRERDSGDAKAAGGYVTLAGVEKFLRGNKPDPGDYRKESDLFDYDPRIGIVVDGQTLTAAEGQLYGIRLLVLKEKACLYAELLPGDGAPASQEWLPSVVPFGGEGKYVRVVGLPQTARWPGAPTGNGRSLWLLAAPAFVGDGKPWPAGLPKGLKAAASGNPLAVSGWDVARNGPLPTRFAVPAGSVYFVEGDFTPENDSLCTDPEHVAQGWGFALRGVWNDG